MREPRLRTVNKATPPFELNHFPSKFVETLAKNIVYLFATKPSMSIEGSEWEQIFAECVGANWRPSNVGLDDVILDNCCWGAKTVYASAKMESQENVRLICGRNSPTYSFGVDSITSAPPDEIGKLVLEIWNERVSGVRQYFKFVRTVVLVKSKDHREYLVFEFNTVRYDPELYTFKWNKKGNLEGYSKADNRHCFTWQPHGSQFTVIEKIPEHRIHLRIKEPEKLDKDAYLKALEFDSSWYRIVSDHIQKD